MDAIAKEILILTPIGRIKWIKAPKSLYEIIYHLSRTFNVSPYNLILFDTNINEEVSDENYLGLISCDWDIILKLHIDLNARMVYNSSLSEPLFHVEKGISGIDTPIKDEREVSKNSDDRPIGSNRRINPDEREIKPTRRQEPDEREIGRNQKKPDPPIKNPLMTNPTPDERTLKRKVSGKGKASARDTKPAAREDKGVTVEEKKMQEFITILGDWGFTDKAKCRAALTKVNFNIEQAADILISDLS